MSAIDVTQLLQEVSAETPCGANLEYDPAFLELEKEATARPEQRIGDSVVPGQEPNWSDVKDRAVDLMRRTKDLRVAVQLSRSLLRTHGAAGLRDGLSLIAGMLERYWDSVYPQLDPDDGNDPTFRLNALANLADWDSMVRGLRDMPLVSSRVLGRFSLRDIEVADGTTAKPADGEAAVPETATIESAFAEADAAELQATADGIRGALESLGSIQSIVGSKVGSTASLDLSRLATTLHNADRILTDQLYRRSGGAPAGAVAGDGAAAGASRGTGVPGEVASRDDVVRLLDKACEYFKRHEPSSPVPLLLQRAKRLVKMDFLEIMKDMAPGGLSEVKSIGGVETEE
jgi:type VI secretion system protein ImpA